MFILGLVVFLLVILVTIMTGVNLAVFIDIPSIVYVLLINLALIISISGFKDFIYGIKLIKLADEKINQEKLNNAIDIFRMLKRSLIGTSIIGFIIGLITLLNRIDNPSIIGPYISVASLVIFYSLILKYGIIIPIEYKLMKIRRSVNKNK